MTWTEHIRVAGAHLMMTHAPVGNRTSPRGDGRATNPTNALVPRFAGPASDDDASRRSVLRALRIGLWAWPSFTVLDAYMCFVAFPGAPFPLFLLYRALVEVAFVALHRAARTNAAGIPLLFRYLNLSFGLAALAISLMAVHLGGLVSPYMHGISIIALVRAALVPTHWRRALPTFARIGLAFPLVMGLSAALSPLARAEWLTPTALSMFVSNYVFVVASAFLGLITGDVVWHTRQQLYRERRVGRYRLHAPIGKGGMGEVWLAWDLALHRNVALKLLHVDSVQGADFVKRFEREARATSQLRGPHVIQIFDFGASDDGLYYLAMEYLIGMDLASLVARFGPLPDARAVQFLVQACHALEEAHTAGIIHRDIKPHNLFVTRVGDDPDFLKLLDFGIVRLRTAAPDAESLTGTGWLVGTPAYAAPEVWNGLEADERSDIYALGITLHYLLTGRTPWRRTPGAGASRTADHTDREVRPSLQPLPHEIAQVVEKCIAPHPDERIQTVRELRRSLCEVTLRSHWTREDAMQFWNAADQVWFT